MHVSSMKSLQKGKIFHEFKAKDNNVHQRVFKVTIDINNAHK